MFFAEYGKRRCHSRNLAQRCTPPRRHDAGAAGNSGWPASIKGTAAAGSAVPSPNASGRLQEPGPEDAGCERGHEGGSARAEGGGRGEGGPARRQGRRAGALAGGKARVAGGGRLAGRRGASSGRGCECAAGGAPGSWLARSAALKELTGSSGISSQSPGSPEPNRMRFGNTAWRQSRCIRGRFGWLGWQAARRRAQHSQPLTARFGLRPRLPPRHPRTERCPAPAARRVP